MPDDERDPAEATSGDQTGGDDLGPGEPRSFGSGRFTVRRRLGAGNFATVYLAFDERLDVPVAVKLLSDRWSWEPEVRGRFVQEARILRSLNDRHVVQIRDIAETDDGRPYLVMDYATEGTLERRLTERVHAGTTLTTGELREFAAELAAALGFLHARRIAHRDIKPSNILVTRDDLAPGDAHRHRRSDGLLRPGERLMLGDLGLAKDLRLDSGITVGVGTAGYMSPEQSSPGAKIDTRTDIYAVSALLAQVASGESPDPMRRYHAGVLTSGRPLPDSVSAGLRTAIERGLDEDPDQRPQTIEEWFAAVDAGIAGSARDRLPPPLPPPGGAGGTGASPPGSELTVSAVGAPSSRRRFVGVAAAGLVVLGGAGVWAVAGRGDGLAGADERSAATSTVLSEATLAETTTIESTASSTSSTSSTTTTVTTTAPTTIPPTTAAPTTTTTPPTTVPPPFVQITGPTEIPANTDGRWWEVNSFRVVRGYWELTNADGPLTLNGNEWIPGDGFRASLPPGAYSLRLAALDIDGNVWTSIFTFTVV
jgi:serine/threonine protein kinase